MSSRGFVLSLDHLFCSWPPYRLRICGPHRAALQIRTLSFAVSQVTHELLGGGRIMTRNDLQYQAILPKRFAFARGVPMGKSSRLNDGSSRLSRLGMNA